MKCNEEVDRTVDCLTRLVMQCRPSRVICQWKEWRLNIARATLARWKQKPDVLLKANRPKKFRDRYEASGPKRAALPDLRACRSGRFVSEHQSLGRGQKDRRGWNARFLDDG